MAKTMNRDRNAQTSVAVPVPAGAKNGDVIPLGSDGLLGYLRTHRVTQAELDDFTKAPPQGLADGEASVEMIGVHLTAKLTVAGATSVFGAVFALPDFTYTADGAAVGAVKIGYALDAQAATGVIEVALSN